MFVRLIFMYIYILKNIRLDNLTEELDVFPIQITKKYKYPSNISEFVFQ